MIDAVTNQDNALKEQLKQEYGLQLDPFSNAVSVFYEGGQRQHNLETLRHLAIFGDMVLLLTGEKGAGKSNLLQEFSSRHSDEVNIVQLSAQQSGSQQSCLARLLMLSGLEILAGEPANETLSRLIEKYNSENQTTHKRTLIVIDDADQLPKSDLSCFVLAFQELSAESGVALLLSGVPEMVDRLSRFNPNGDNEWLHQVQLKPFSEEDIQSYFDLRLQAAGMTGELPISSAQMRQLIEVGKGLPGRLNKVFSVIMLGAGEFKSKPDRPEANMAQRVLFGIALILLFSFGFVSYQYGLLDFESGDDASESLQTDNLKEEQDRVNAQRELAEQQAAARLAMLDKAIEESTPEAAEIRDVGSDVVNNQELEVSNVAAPAQVEGVTDAVAKAAANQDGENSQAQEADVEVSPDAEADSAPEIDVVSAGTEPSSDNKKDVLALIPVEDQVSRHFAYRPASWVQKKPSTSYSLQVLGSHNEETAQRFIERSGVIRDELSYIETRYKNKAWYVVLYGEYGTKEKASSGARAAPKYIKKQQPWMRSFGAIADTLP